MDHLNWNLPIEVCCGGQWFPAVVTEFDNGDTSYPYRLAYGIYNDQWFNVDGENCVAPDYVRNVEMRNLRN